MKLLHQTYHTMDVIPHRSKLSTQSESIPYFRHSRLKAVSLACSFTYNATYS